MAELLTTSSLLALVALTALEIVLGVDNLVFIASLTDRLPRERQPFARRTAVLSAVAVMLWFISPVSSFIERHLVFVVMLNLKLRGQKVNHAPTMS